ncbi:MAG: Uncharacterised protein [Candidatus Poseidoniaceae archaeon]|nr:MAG: Uncharacterised protein [Candidatus Poseidoniaceae archaeon]
MEEDGQDHDSVEDDVLRQKEFRRGGGIDLGQFMIQELENEVIVEEAVPEKETDEAVGEIAALFSSEDEQTVEPGAIKRDGTVDEAAAPDSVTDMAVHGERRLGYGLLAGMVLVWSVLGWVVGTALPPFLGGPLLIIMGLSGLWAGEKWIPNPTMHLLGVTWVIISMKILYGFALDVHHWGWLDASPLGADLSLGIFLLVLIGFNILIAQRHDDDAIAAQATLVLLALGSATGALYDDLGVAGMILLGTLSMHGLALHRKSGNLASLGIAVSYLWIGLHAFSNDWTIVSIEIVSFDDDLLLFMLMFAVTATNAVMATQFHKADNWFSAAAKALGLGKPGLWAISVGLGMIGALLSIAANRDETGYALAQLLLLMSAFGGSYLAVRGVEWKRLAPFILFPAPFLLILVILLNQEVFTVDIANLSAYSIYAILTALLTSIALLRNQQAVSDHVLWMGGIIIVILLTILIPAETDGWRLLTSQATVWLGLAWLGVQRQSPSISGVAVLMPWVWLLMFATDVESRMFSNDFIPVVLDEQHVAAWMLLLIVQQLYVNLSQGQATLNLAGRLAGLSELGARARDSGLLQLWNLSFVLSLVSVWGITRVGGMPAWGLIGIMAAILVFHGTLVALGQHRGQPRTMLVAWSIFALHFGWKFGHTSMFAATMVAGCSLMLVHTDRFLSDRDNAKRNQTNSIVTYQLLVMSALLAIPALRNDASLVLTNADWFPQDGQDAMMVGLISLGTLFHYLSRVTKMDKLLPPTLATVAMIGLMLFSGTALELQLLTIMALLSFVGSGAYLAFQGEWRSGMRSVARRDERLREIEAKQRTQIAYNQTSEQTGVQFIDPKMIELAEKQKKRAKRAGSTGEMDLELGDIQHRPSIVLSFIGVTIFASTSFAYLSGSGMIALLLMGGMSFLFISLARLRADSLNLRLVDVLGVEIPIAVTMAGLVLVHLASRMTQGTVFLNEQFDLLTLISGLVALAGFALVGRNDLGVRIPNVLDMVVGLLVIDRLFGVLAGGELPIPTLTNPLEFDEMAWMVPVIGNEVLLIGAALLWNWVERERQKRNLQDHRGALGRISFGLSILLLSFGPAAMVALTLMFLRGWEWKQPAVLMIGFIVLPVAFNELVWWVEDEFSLTLFEMWMSSVAIGTLGLIAGGVATYTNQGLWVSASLWVAQVLFIVTGLLSPSLLLFVLLTLAMSTTSWVIGVLTLRRGWRIVGFFNLVLAWIVASVLIFQGMTSFAALALLLATAALLAIITYLTQSRDELLASQ